MSEGKYSLRTRKTSENVEPPSTPQKNLRETPRKSRSINNLPVTPSTKTAVRTPISTRTRSRTISNDCQTPTKSSGTPGRRSSMKISESNIDGETEKTVVRREMYRQLFDQLETIEEDVQKSSELFHDGDVSGDKIYHYQTPRKKNAMIEKALLSRTPIIETPKKSARVLLDKIDISNTPKSINRRSSRLSTTPQTRGLGKRQHRQVSFVSSDSEESVSEDSEYCPSDAEEDNDDDQNEENENPSDNENENEEEEEEDDSSPERNRDLRVKKIQIPITPCRRGRSRNNIVYNDYHVKTDEYFESQANKALTSDHTLNLLKTPRMNEEKLQELLSSQEHISMIHKKSICSLSENYSSQFGLWYQIMEEGYSILLHGLGSKRNIINEFHQNVIINHPTLIVNGFYPSLTINDILNGIVTDLLELDCPINQNECFDLIEKTLNENPDDRLYLLVHNIDGTMLKSKKSQDILSRLAAIKNIRLLASVDHINAPIIWDNAERSRYNFFWWDATSFLPYEAETSYESSLLVQRSGALALSSLNNVFASLPDNAKAIYIVLVKYQIENGKGNQYSGMAFKDLYRSSREFFFVSSELALRAQLTEYIDHKLVKTKRNFDGTEYLIIPLNNSLLKKFLEDHESA